jgi:hypothetical protein
MSESDHLLFYTGHTECIESQRGCLQPRHCKQEARRRLQICAGHLCLQSFDRRVEN